MFTSPPSHLPASRYSTQAVITLTLLAFLAQSSPGLIPVAAGAPAEPAKEALFCAGIKSAEDAQKVSRRWEKEFNAANSQHQAASLSAERNAYLARAGVALREVCLAKVESEARYQALRASAQKAHPAAGESCDAFRAQEDSVVAGGEARQVYIQRAKELRDGKKGTKGEEPGLRELFRKGSAADQRHVEAQADAAKPALEQERVWAWGAKAGGSDGYFTRVQRQFEAEVRAAEAAQQEIAGYLKGMQQKNPSCKLSDRAKKLEGGKFSNDPSQRESLAAASANEPGVSGPADGSGATGGARKGEGEGGGTSSSGASANSGAGTGAEAPGEGLLGENTGLIVGGVALAGAAGAAAFVLTNKEAKRSVASLWDDLFGGGKKKEVKYPGQGSAPLPRAATIGVKESFAFSTGLALSPSRESASEARWTMSEAEHEARYQKLKEMGIGYRFYNYFWSGIENGALSSTLPQACAEGYLAIPADEQTRVRLGYHRFHCYQASTVQTFDKLLRQDAAAGFQSGVVMWSSPSGYRYPDCEGMNWAGGRMKDGCVPRDDAMDDFEDYANFLASRYNGASEGKISHFVVWNENGSEEWFDYSPVAPKGPTSGPVVEKRLDKYADMLKRTHAALARHQKKSLMYVSTDPLWDTGLAGGHMGSRVLLEGIWKRLGTDYSWSVAVHPYGNVYQPAGAGHYSFANLEIVYDYQASKLAEKGVTDPMTYPQAYLFATEQGWGIEPGGKRDNQARNICLAHDRITRMPWMIGNSHNYFHSHEADELGNGTSSQGSYFGLIPYAIPNNLEGVEQTPTGAAFFATGPARWAKDASNFCCVGYKVGCP